MGEAIINRTDTKIIEALLSDARLSYRQVGKKCGTSAATAMTHIRKMENDGIIKGYTVCLNHEKLGYEITAVTELVVPKGKMVEVGKQILNYPGVCSIYNITGPSDGIVIAKFKNRKELSEFTKWMLSLPLIQRTNTHLVLNTVKEDFGLL
jgi:DNA-binding Lrp family transcriptional regulator